MNLTESKKQATKFFTSQYIYSGVRIALAIVVPSLILAYLGVLKEYFLFPLGTSFVGLTDMAGPYHRRRNTLILACFLFTIIALFGSLFRDYTILIFIEIIFWGIFLSMIGIYGIRLATVGGLGLVVMAIFLNGDFSSDSLWTTLGSLFLGGLWYVVVFMSVSRLQPYKLAQQMIGENYFQLAAYSRIKAKYYDTKNNITSLDRDLIAQQITIKNLQEETREVVFMTRKIVHESTTTSRLLMLMFLNSIDFYEKLITNDHDYRTLHNFFKDEQILVDIQKYIETMSDELEQIGVSIQSGFDLVPKTNLIDAFEKLNDKFLSIKQKYKNEESHAPLQKISFILERIKDATLEVVAIQKFKNQDMCSANSLSTGLDYKRFVPKSEKLNHKVLLANFSLKSFHFRYAIRMTSALLLGYAISLIPFFNIGYPYWILITIVAIMRPAFSATKGRNILRIYGTIGGAIASYLILIYIHSPAALLFILLSSMILCFSFLKDNYAWAVFFMTIYIFITFNFMNPGNINSLFLDRLIDTFIAGGIVFIISYLVLPVWEHRLSSVLINKSVTANKEYFSVVMRRLIYNDTDDQDYRLKRKDAIISLANLSDNFQRMISDPKKEQKIKEYIHQFVNTTHLITAYTASLSQYSWHEEYQNNDELKHNFLIISESFENIISLLNNTVTNNIENTDRYANFPTHESVSKSSINHIHDVMLLLKEVVYEQERLVKQQMAEIRH